MGWVFIFAALHSKLRRVNLVFANAQKFRRLKVTIQDALYAFTGVFLVNFVVLLVWTILEPVTWDRELKTELESIGRCNFHIESTPSKILMSILVAVNCLALVMANIEAFKARRVATEYGESSYIGLAMGSMLQALMVALPLIILVENNPSAEFFISATFVFIVAMAILLLIFVPKIIAWRQKEQRGTRRGAVSGLAFRVTVARPGVSDKQTCTMISVQGKTFLPVVLTLCPNFS